MAAHFAREQLKKQFNDLNRDHTSGYSIGLIDDDWLKWRVCIPGPRNTVYQDGYFSATMTFPEAFPNEPPVMRFETPMFHPNIYPDGTVCISILHPPGEDQFNEQETADERWRPIIGVEAILTSVILLLSDPNLSSPANVDAARMMKDDPEEYKKKVKKLVRATME
eukprot:GHVU01088221.1.p2 GENE.GHVU01088221.1~~GHVU01088221.1.p2  ORF type:complete len:166 (+),score=39.13 GHVU01088221.1:847-1344(+)